MRKYYKYHSSGLFVASDGEVFVGTNRANKEHFTYGCTDSNGYKVVKYKGKLYYVHRLVAECYLPNPDNLPTIDHIDRNPSNNNVENLRWADMSLQVKNRGKYTRPNAPKNNARSKPVIQYTKDGQLVREWPSAAECGRNGFKQSNVAACCNGKRKSHKGYIFKYKEEELEQI